MLPAASKAWPAHAAVSITAAAIRDMAWFSASPTYLAVAIDGSGWRKKKKGRLVEHTSPSSWLLLRTF